MARGREMMPPENPFQDKNLDLTKSPNYDPLLRYFRMTRNLRRATMADEQWYLLRIRNGFNSVVLSKLARLSLQVVVPSRKSVDSQKPGACEDYCSYLYCLCCPENRRRLVWIPGVLDACRTDQPANH